LSRSKTLIGFWIVGYVLGLFAWLVKSPVIQFAEGFGLSPDASMALIMGLTSSTVMVVGVLAWSFMSSD
jgi:hypothetical protein